MRMVVKNLEENEEVVFKQTPDGSAENSEYPIYVENDTAYQVHHGVVLEIERDFAKIKWDDGEVTTTPKDRLNYPKDVDWYPVE